MYFKRDYRPQKGQCFILMPFGEKLLPDGHVIDWDERYQVVLEPAITAIGMKPGRADDIFGTQPLIDRVWRGIQEAEVVVAELTGRSPNVMYEIGLAHLIGKRLVLLTMNPDDVPADLAQSVQVRYSDDGVGLLKLSRELQANLQAAREDPLNEAMLVPLKGGEIEKVPARVEFVAPGYAMVRSQSNRMGFLRAEDVAYSKIVKDMQRQFRAGQQVDGAFVFDVEGEARYSLIADQENPWPKLIAEFPEGSSFVGEVKSAPENIGAFVVLRYGINGLIHRGGLQGLADGPLQPGDEVEAVIRQVNPPKRQVELGFRRLIQRGPADQVQQRPTDEDWKHYQPNGTFTGSIQRIAYDRGFVLIALPPGRTGLLNVSRMSPAARQRFEEESLQVGDEIGVEIVEVQPQRNRILLRDADA